MGSSSITSRVTGWRGRYRAPRMSLMALMDSPDRVSCCLARATTAARSAGVEGGGVVEAQKGHSNNQLCCGCCAVLLDLVDALQ